MSSKSQGYTTIFGIRPLMLLNSVMSYKGKTLIPVQLFQCLKIPCIFKTS